MADLHTAYGISDEEVDLLVHPERYLHNLSKQQQSVGSHVLSGHTSTKPHTVLLQPIHYYHPTHSQQHSQKYNPQHSRYNQNLLYSSGLKKNNSTRCDPDAISWSVHKDHDVPDGKILYKLQEKIAKTQTLGWIALGTGTAAILFSFIILVVILLSRRK